MRFSCACVSVGGRVGLRNSLRGVRMACIRLFPKCLLLPKYLLLPQLDIDLEVQGVSRLRSCLVLLS